jgi:hypothetical protein
MLAEGTLGVVYDVDGVLRLGTLQRQLRRIRGLVRSSTRDHRSVLGMPTPFGL